MGCGMIIIINDNHNDSVYTELKKLYNLKNDEIQTTKYHFTTSGKILTRITFLTITCHRTGHHH